MSMPLYVLSCYQASDFQCVCIYGLCATVQMLRYRYSCCNVIAEYGLME